MRGAPGWREIAAHQATKLRVYEIGPRFRAVDALPLVSAGATGLQEDEFGPIVVGELDLGAENFWNAHVVLSAYGNSPQVL